MCNDRIGRHRRSESRQGQRPAELSLGTPKMFPGTSSTAPVLFVLALKKNVLTRSLSFLTHVPCPHAHATR